MPQSSPFRPPGGAASLHDAPTTHAYSRSPEARGETHMDRHAMPSPEDTAERARLRLYETILEAIPDLIYVFDRNHRFIYANPALLTMWGRTWEESIGRNCLELGYEPWHAAMHDDEIERVVATRQPIRGEVPFPHTTLGTRIYDYIFIPVLSPDGEVEAIAGTTRDVTERKRQEEALRRSENRLSAMVNASSDIIYRISPDWQDLALVGGRAADRLSRNGDSRWAIERIHPDDRTRVVEAIQRAREALAPYEAEHRVEIDAGSWSWIRSHAVPIREDDGTVTEWFGAATDITERVRQEEHLRLLVNELNHRVKNTLAIVQSMVSQTLRNCDGSAQALEMVESRLQALAATHDVLTRQKWQGATLDEIVHTAIGHCLGVDASRFEVQGEAICLEPRRAVALSMALHELCTNAMKYGALSVPGGRVGIHWAREGGEDGTLVLDWRERGGPPVAPPAARGFGSRLIERGLQHDLGGSVSLVFEPGGVHCHVRTPLSRAHPRGQP
jgi:PAS domain S-box-containing protein